MRECKVEVWTRATREAPARLARVHTFQVSESAPVGYPEDLARRMAEITGTDWRIINGEES